MQILLNTIALEPNRWTEGKHAHYRLEDLLEPIAGAGFDALEVWQFHLIRRETGEVEEIARRARELGLSFPVLGAYPAFHLKGAAREEELRKLDRMVEMGEILDGSALKMLIGGLASEDITPPKWDACVSFGRELIRRTEGSGLVFPIECHGGGLGDDPQVLARFLEEVGSGRFKVCWQPLDMADTEGAIALYDRLADRIGHLHLQGRRGGQMELLEEADIDYHRVLSHIFGADFDGWASIEFVRGCRAGSPEEFDLEAVLANAARDREFVRAVRAEAGR